MRCNKVMGIIFANTHEEVIPGLTAKRTMGSLPYGARYRLIDFPISNMVHAGIRKIGVTTKQNYHSLMDHLGSGKPWGLSRKRDGLFILPPFGSSNMQFSSRIETLSAISNFINAAKEDYILLSDCDVVCNIDYSDFIESHINKNADATLVYAYDVYPQNFGNALVINLDSEECITKVNINSSTDQKCNFSLNMMLFKRKLLLDLLKECIDNNQTDFKSHIIKKNFKKYNFFGYKFNGTKTIITSRKKYFEANMKLINSDFRKELFSRPIYTKVYDDAPTKYGSHSDIKNSIIAEGCIIDGQVENSILFRGVHIGKHTHISNCIIMQDTYIQDNCQLSYIICDKDVIISSQNKLNGCKTYPMYIKKLSVI